MSPPECKQNKKREIKNKNEKNGKNKILTFKK